MNKKLEEFQKLLEFFPDSMIVTDSSGKIIMANSQVEELLGYKKEELFQQPIEILVPERFRKAHVGHRTNFMAAPHTRPMGAGLDLYAQHKNGTDIPVEISLSPMKSEEGTIIIAALRDVSERKRALKELQLLHSITEDISEVKDFHSALGIVIRRICEMAGWDYGEAWLYDGREKRLKTSPAWYSNYAAKDFRAMTEHLFLETGGGLPGRVWLSRNPEWVQDISKSPNALFSRTGTALKANFKSAFATPVTANGEVIAVLAFFMAKMHGQDERLIKVISTVATQLGLVMQRKKAEEALMKAHSELEEKVLERTAEVRKLQKEILEISEAEQRRIGQDLHDGAGQTLTAVTYMAQFLHKRLSEKNLSEAEKASEIVQYVSDAIEHVRRLARGLYPVELTRHGLAPALKELASTIEAQHRIPCRVTEEGLPELAHEKSIQLYRIAQEAINNAVKHAKPKTILLVITQNDGEVTLTIDDDGIGIQPGKREKGMGLDIMKYRAQLMGGSLDIKSRAEGGTQVSCTIQK